MLTYTVETWLRKFQSWVALKERQGEAELETEIEDHFKWMDRLKLFGYVQVIEQYSYLSGDRSEKNCEDEENT